jgi:hypothetical protein
MTSYSISLDCTTFRCFPAFSEKNTQWKKLFRGLERNCWPVVGGVNDTADQGGRSLIFWLDPDPHSKKSGAGSDLNLTLSHNGTADQWWAVSMTPLTLAGWCQWHCGFKYANFVQKLSCVIETTDQWWAVSMTPLTSGGWCQWHRWPVVGGVNDIADQNWHPWPGDLKD